VSSGKVLVKNNFVLYQEHEKRCWSVDYNHMDPLLLASGSDDCKGNMMIIRMVAIMMMMMID
jgi:hypothetical protein